MCQALQLLVQEPLSSADWDRCGLSFPTIWKKMRDGTFPRSREVGVQKKLWIESEIDAWIDAQPKTRLKGDVEAA
jgi:prophage regulatory protein